ncbi:MAG: hypothetical protein ACOYWZ_17310 [Bacillota bacterium]
MKGVANSILAAILVSFFMLSFTNFLLFFPWYLTLVYKTFNVATEASTINYVSGQMVEDALNDLETRPMYRDKINSIVISMDNVAVSRYSNDNTRRLQKGEKFNVSIEADFPFVVKIFGQEFKRELDIKFSIPVTGIRYYKDLDPYVI